MVLNNGYRNSNEIVISKRTGYSHFTFRPFINSVFLDEQIIIEALTQRFTLGMDVLQTKPD